MIRKKDIEEILHALSDKHGYIDKAEFQKKISCLPDLSNGKIKQELRAMYKQDNIVKGARDLRGKLVTYQNNLRTRKTILFRGEKYSPDTIITSALSEDYKIYNVVASLGEIAQILGISNATASRLVRIGIIERVHVVYIEIAGEADNCKYLYLLDKTRNNLNKYIESTSLT